MFRSSVRRRGRRASQLGQTLIILALMFTLMLGIAGLAIDVSHNYVDRRAAQSGSDAAAMAAGETLASAGTVLTSAPSVTSKPVKAAHDFAANNGFNTVIPGANKCDQSSGNSFTTTWFDSSYTPSSLSQCSVSKGFVTKVTVNDPPCGITASNGTVPFALTPTAAANCAGVDPNQKLPTTDCNQYPYNCVQVVITTRTTNYILGFFGQTNWYTTVASTAFAEPPQGSGTQPPPAAVYLYEKGGSTCTSGQCFNNASQPARSLLGIGGSGTCQGGTNNCPTFWVIHGTQPEFYGYNQSSLGTDYPAVQSNGDMILGDNTVFCDPTTSAGNTCQQTNGLGTAGFSINGTGNAPGSLLYCNNVDAGHGGAVLSGWGCTQKIPPPPAGGGQNTFTNGNLQGSQANFTSETYTASVDTSKLTDCQGGLILNGEAVATALTNQGLNAACAPVAGDEYTIQPGIYKYIVINHGEYFFDSGTYDITGTAPVDTNTNNTCTAAWSTSSQANANCVANGIDHQPDQAPGPNGYGGDFDLCNGGQPNSCGGVSTDTGKCTLSGNTYSGSDCLTAGVWITKGGLHNYNASSGSASSCPSGGGGGSVGSQGGGGSDAVISGAGVTFKFESTSGGFVSTRQVKSIALSAPGPGASSSTNGASILFDLENSSFIHLDGKAPNNTSAFTGIIYQIPTATGGGVELNPGMTNGNAPGKGSVVAGQILAYSLTTFGQKGQAVDFTPGYGGSSLPVISNSGRNETSIVTSATLAAGPSNTAIFTLNYGDEWALDMYDTYLIVGSANPQFFSQGMWTNATPANPPENPNDVNGASPGAYPSDTNPQYPSNATSGSFASNNASTPAYVTKLDPYTNQWTDYSVTTPFAPGGGNATFEVTGAWTWGHEKDITGNTKYNPDNAVVTYTFPVANLSNTVSITMGLYDGDHCGDYAVYSATFNTPGSPGGGSQVNGNVLLEQ